MPNKRVEVSLQQVRFFAQTWPNCYLTGPITFEYASNGDLVDVYGIDTDTLNEENDRALLALSYDAAKGYGRIF